MLSVRQVLGQDVTALQDFTRPPLAPGWLLVPFVEIWGMDIGYKIWSAFASTAPILAAYYLTQRILSKRTALVTSALMAVSFVHAEMLVTGALPLLGFSLIAVALGLISKLSEHWSGRMFNLPPR